MDSDSANPSGQPGPHANATPESAATAADRSAMSAAPPRARVAPNCAPRDRSLLLRELFGLIACGALWALLLRPASGSEVHFGPGFWGWVGFSAGVCSAIGLAVALAFELRLVNAAVGACSGAMAGNTIAYCLQSRVDFLSVLIGCAALVLIATLLAPAGGSSLSEADSAPGPLGPIR